MTLHTNGNEFILDDAPYIGAYNKGPDNNHYTGDVYIFGVSKFLTPINIESVGYRIGDEDYDRLESEFTQREINYAKDFYPTISEKDKKNGFIYRYFVQQWNDRSIRVIEISGDQFGNIDRGFYQTIKIKWIIVGDIITVSSSNSDEISAAMIEMPAIASKLNNTIELYNVDRNDII